MRCASRLPKCIVDDDIYKLMWSLLHSFLWLKGDPFFIRFAFCDNFIGIVSNEPSWQMIINNKWKSGTNHNERQIFSALYSSQLTIWFHVSKPDRRRRFHVNLLMNKHVLERHETCVASFAVIHSCNWASATHMHRNSNETEFVCENNSRVCVDTQENVNHSKFLEI